MLIVSDSDDGVHARDGREPAWIEMFQYAEGIAEPRKAEVSVEGGIPIIAG